MPSEKVIIIPCLADLPEIVRQIRLDFGNSKIWVFEGEMGAGKTTFIQELLRQIGVDEPEGSPTYSLVNVYDMPDGKRFCHLDLYRLNSAQEALDIGLEDMLFDGSSCLIEWPEIVKDWLPIETIWFKLSILEDNQKRQIIVRT